MDIIKKQEEKNTSIPIDTIKENKIFPHASSKEIIKFWHAEEFSYYEKSKSWFLVGGVFFFLIVGYFMIVKEIITAITFLLLGVTVYLFSLKKPRTVDCTITYHSISIDTVTYPFTDIDSFWIFYEPPDFKVISLKHKKPYLPHIQIPLGDEDPMEVRQILMELLTEVEQEEAFSDKMSRYLRF